MSTELKLPPKMFLYFIVETPTWSYYTTSENGGMDGYQGKWHLVAEGDVIWPANIPVFDENAAKLAALTAKMGEAQQTINKCKEEIQKLLAIGHDGGHVEDDIVL